MGFSDIDDKQIGIYRFTFSTQPMKSSDKVMWVASHGWWWWHPSGGSWENREPLSSDLNKMAWICHSVYPSVWSKRGTHTKKTTTWTNLAVQTTTAIVLLFLFFFLQLYILCFVFQISFIKLPVELTLILAMFPKPSLFPLPSLYQTILPTPAQITTPPSLGSILLSALSTPPLLIPLFIFRILIGSPAPSCKPIQLPLLSSFA